MDFSLKLLMRFLFLTARFSIEYLCIVQEKKFVKNVPEVLLHKPLNRLFVFDGPGKMRCAVSSKRLCPHTKMPKNAHMPPYAQIVFLQIAQQNLGC